MQTDYLIIGGGIAGTTAAETIRQNDPKGSIAIVSDEPHRLYSRITLSKINFFLEKLPFDSIWLKQSEWYDQKNISLLAGKRAAALDTQKKEVALDDGTVIQYGKLLLAIGGSARKLEIPGSAPEDISYLRTLDDAKTIIQKTRASKEGIMIGGGFIGFEMCEMMRLAGLKVTLIIREPRFWDFLIDATSSALIEEALEKNGVTILRNEEVREIAHNGKKLAILKSGQSIPFDMLIAGIGIYCPHAFIKEAGIAVQSGIIANEYLETSAPDVWTAGDSAEFKDLILEEQIQLGNWVNAQIQGRIAGLNMTGTRTPFKLISSYTSRAFDLSLAFVGDVRMREGRRSIPRGSKESGSYAQIIVEGTKIKGAILINRTKELGIIGKLIQEGADVSDRDAQLADADLKALL